MSTSKKRVSACAAAVGLLGSIALAAPSEADSSGLKASAKDMAWWRAARFGLFVHWGPVSLKGTEIGWSRGGERRGRKDRGSQIPVEVYDNLYKQFNPTKFDAAEWASIAKSAGMKYLVFSPARFTTAPAATASITTSHMRLSHHSFSLKITSR